MSKKRLIPFMEKNHNEKTVLFWPDKATSNYAKKTLQILHIEILCNMCQKYQSYQFSTMKTHRRRIGATVPSCLSKWLASDKCQAIN